MVLKNMLKSVKQVSTRIVNLSLATIIGFSSLVAATPLLFPAHASAISPVVDVRTGLGYSTIQLAINDVSTISGDTINVADGTYTENVNVSKAVSIVGAGASTTSIVATDANSFPLTFSTNGATVSGFTITHSYTLTELSAWSSINNNGVTFGSGTSGNTLQNNTVTLNRNGIYLNNSSANIRNNLITNNRTGINLTNTVNNTQITGNTISNNWTLGVIYYSLGNATDFSTVTVTGNTFNQNWYTEVEIKNAGSSTGTLDVTSNTFTDTPVTYTTSSDASLNEPGFTAQRPVVLGGTATKPVIDLPTLRIFNSGTANLKYTGKTLEVGTGKPYTTIQSAVTDVSAGDTIYVRNGAYTGAINITKGIQLVGESKVGVVVTQDSTTPFGQGISIVGVSGSTISNMTFNSPAGSPIYYALAAYQSTGLNLNNLTFIGPGKSGLNASGKKIGGVDINSSQSVNYNNINVSNYSKNGFSFTAQYTISDTATSNLNLSNIAADNNGWAGVAFYTMNSSSTVGHDITGVTFGGSNSFTNNGQGIFVEGDSDANLGTLAAPRFKITGSTSTNAVSLNNSVFTGNTKAVVNYQTNSLNASLNYWGSATPDFGSIISGSNVTYSPWFINSLLTIRSDAKVVPDSSGNANVNNTTPQVVVTSSTQPISITVASGTNNATIDYSSLMTTANPNTVTIPQTTVVTTGGNISIPAATTVTATGGTANWNGVINAPTVKPNTTVTVPTPSGSTTTVGTVITVGSDSVNLTFDKAVRLLIPGQKGKLVGFVRAGESAFTPISTQCQLDNRSSVDSLLNASGKKECYFDNGTDTIVWTKHFTTFVTYTQTATPVAAATPVATVAPVAKVQQTYTVVAGDTLSGIGVKVGADWHFIASLNGIRAPYTIYPRQVLQLPDGSVTPSASATSAPTPSSNVTTTSVLGESSNPQIGTAINTTVGKPAVVASTVTKKANWFNWYWFAAGTAVALAAIYYAYQANKKPKN